ncbi:primosomal protein [Agromyces sp. NPDC058110]|uniref:primosomal protein n=1 Tax=Agromyces sp. NPDC058110 TaxID=3346345 RepID=UPI0036DDB4FA
MSDTNDETNRGEARNRAPRGEGRPQSSGRGANGSQASRSSRDGQRSYGDREKRPYEKRDGAPRSYGDREKRPYEKRDGERRPYEKRDGAPRSYGDREKRPYEKRDGERRPYEKRDGAPRSYGDREKRPYEKRDGERRPYEKRDGAPRSYGDREKRPYEKRDGAPRSYGDREKRPYEKRDGAPRSYGDREKRPYEKRDGERRPYEKRDGAPRSYGDREKRPYEKRDGAPRSYGDRDDRRGQRAPREEYRRESDGASSLAVRPRHDDPFLPDTIEPRQLDKGARAELKTLSKENADWVARHLVAASLYLDEDPELAHQHAVSAGRRAGRVAVVRETLAITAYATGDFALALRELRTYRRISGSNDQLPLMVDSERGVGRPDRALEVGRAVDRSSLPAAVQVGLAIAMSGARLDLDQPELALAELEIPQLDPDRAFSYSPALFSAYAEVLDELGRSTDAAEWRARAARAEDALGGAELDLVEIYEVELEPAEFDVAEADVEDGASDQLADADGAAAEVEEPASAAEQVDDVDDLGDPGDVLEDDVRAVLAEGDDEGRA